MKHWVEELSRNLSLSEVVLVVAANKSDLPPSERAVSAAEVAAYAAVIHAESFATSAKTSAAVEPLFLHVARTVADRRTEGAAIEGEEAVRLGDGEGDGEGEGEKPCPC